MRNSTKLWVLLAAVAVGCGDDAAGDSNDSGASADAGADTVEDDIAVQDAADTHDEPGDVGGSTDTADSEDAVADITDITDDEVAADAAADADAARDTVTDVDAPDDAVELDAADSGEDDAGPIVCEYLDLYIYIADCAGGSQYVREFVDVAGNPEAACPAYWVPGDSFLRYDSAEDALAADNCDLDCLRRAGMSVSALRCDRRMGWIEFVDDEGDCADVLEFADGFYASVDAWCAEQGACPSTPEIGDVCGEGPPE